MASRAEYNSNIDSLRDNDMTIETITAAALALPAESRAALAEVLLSSLDQTTDAEEPQEIEITHRAEWEREIEERIDALDRGEIETVSREEVMRRLGKLS
jgi:Putative addiction module component.